VFEAVGGGRVRVTVRVGGWVGVRVRVAVAAMVADGVTVGDGVSVGVAVVVTVGVAVSVNVADGVVVAEGDAVGEGESEASTDSVSCGWNGVGEGADSTGAASGVGGGFVRPVNTRSSCTVRSSWATLPTPIASAASTRPKKATTNTTGISARPSTIVPHG